MVGMPTLEASPPCLLLYSPPSLLAYGRKRVQSVYHSAEATERSPIDGGDGDSCGFSLSAYCCIPLQLLWPMPTSQKPLALAKVIITNMRVKSMAGRLEWVDQSDIFLWP
jgi:hypothetical protein